MSWLCEAWDDDQLLELEAGDDHAPPEGREVMFVAVAYALDQAVHAQAFEQARELGVGQVWQMRSQVLAAQPADVELATGKRGEQALIEGAEEIEATVGAPVIVFGFRQALEIGLAGAVIGEFRQEGKVALVGCAEQFTQVGQAIDRLLQWRELKHASAIALFHRAVVFEKGHIVHRGLDSEDRAELVVHLDGSAIHVMLDAGALDAGREAAAQLLGKARIKAPSEKVRHLLGLDRENRRAADRLIQGRERGSILEHDVGGELRLHDAPVHCS